MRKGDVEEELDGEIKDLTSELEEKDVEITNLEEKIQNRDEEIKDLKSELEDLQERDIHDFLEKNPEQLLDVMVPDDVAVELFRARIIDCNTASSLTFGEFFDLLME